MFVLDTDHLSLLLGTIGSDGKRLRIRLDNNNDYQLITTIIIYEEQVRGWLALSSKARSTDQMIFSYDRLKRHLEAFRRLTVLDFDRGAAVVFSRLKSFRLRVGTMDLKIAAIVICRDATLLSRNLVDFHKIPGLKVEDCSV